jgi:hypothetical protein
MTRTRTLHRWTLAALSAALLTITIAQSAQADPGWRRWQRVNHGRPAGHAMRFAYRDADRGGAGPMLAGLIGGFVLGATMARPQEVVVHERVYAPPPPRYRYEDASGERWWDTLDECREAALDRYGPRVIRIVDARTDRCVETLYWKHDHFISDSDGPSDGPYRDDSRDD